MNLFVPNTVSRARPFIHLLPVLPAVPTAVQAQTQGQGQGLPTVEPPTRGNGNGILDTVHNYSYDIVLLVALLVISSMFIGVSYHAYTTYSEIHNGRKTWGEFGLTVAAGTVLLVVGIWLLSKATQIL